jgi:hypothetical protein
MMTGEEHLELWRKVKAASLDGLDVVGFAIVAVHRNGEVYYGADFSLDARVREQIRRYLAITQHDLKQTDKALAKGA